MTTPTFGKKPAAAPASIGAVEDSKSDYKLLRICCWCVALALGAAQAWATRFTMNPDGISYLDIGDAYWRGDWHNAINAYWSPLYSWILGFFLKVLKPSMYWEYPLVHLVNFLIYLASLACFEFFLKTFIADRKRADQELLRDGQSGLPEPFWWLLGYSIFVSSSLILIGLHLVTPDVCVAAFVYLASALILKIHRRAATRKTYIGLGIVLGFAYLAKAVMFPLGLMYIAAAIFATGEFSAQSLRRIAPTLVVFVVIAGPFAVAISLAKERPTFGDSGKITYQIFADDVDIFIPREKDVRHPPDQIFDHPLAYRFAPHGTYSPWYDPSYWHEGIKSKLHLQSELQLLKYAFFSYVLLLGSIFRQLNLTVALLMLYAITSEPRAALKRTATYWIIITLALFAVISYAVVYTEHRYVAAFLALLWMTLFAGIRLPPDKMARWLAASLVFGISSTTALVVVWSILSSTSTAVVPYAQVAAALTAHGLQPGDEIAAVANEPFADGGAFVARLARLRIVAQTRNMNEFNAATPRTRAALYETFRKAGTKAVLLHGKRPEDAPETRWDGLAGGFFLQDTKAIVSEARPEPRVRKTQ